MILLKSNSGIAIIIDYGYLAPLNYSTLQSVKLHRTTNILDNPGNQDITSFVNFHDLLEIAKKNNLHIYGPVTQKEFLKKTELKKEKTKFYLKLHKNKNL